MKKAKGCLMIFGFFFLALFLYFIFSGDDVEQIDESSKINLQEDVVAEDEMNAKKDSLQKIGLERLAKLKKETDEFEGTTFYEDKRSPNYINENFVYPYIVSYKGNYLKLRLQYTANDWLFIDHVKFKADDKIVLEITQNFKRDNDGGRIWEYANVSMDLTNIHALWQIAHAKKSMVRYVGNQYRKDRVLTKKEKDIITNVVTTYCYLEGLPLPKI